MLMMSGQATNRVDSIHRHLRRKVESGYLRNPVEDIFLSIWLKVLVSLAIFIVTIVQIFLKLALRFNGSDGLPYGE